MDTPAFETLLDECGWLRRLARHLVDDPSDAEDVAQEACLLDPRESPRALGRFVGPNLMDRVLARGENKRNAQAQAVLVEKWRALRPLIEVRY